MSANTGEGMCAFFESHTGLKYIFFGGKGGVGKTAFAGATALYLAEQGRKVLLASTNPVHSLSGLLKQDVFGKETQVTGTPLIAVEIDDVPGSMAHFLEAISKVNDTVGSIQVFPSGISRDKAIVLIESDQPSLHDAIATAGYRELAYTDLT